MGRAPPPGIFERAHTWEVEDNRAPTLEQLHVNLNFPVFILVQGFQKMLRFGHRINSLATVDAMPLQKYSVHYDALGNRIHKIQITKKKG